MTLFDNEGRLKVLSDAETPPSRPGRIFYAAAIIVLGGIAYLTYWPSVSSYLGL